MIKKCKKKIKHLIHVDFYKESIHTGVRKQRALTSRNWNHIRKIGPNILVEMNFPNVYV